MLIAVIAVLLLLSGIVFLPIINSLSDYLSKTTRVKANVLLVEGWLTPDAIERSYDEFKNNSYEHVITTGTRISGYFQVSMNGYLIFYTGNRFKGIDNTGDHIIEVDAYSELGENNRAHFNVFINDSIVADFFAGTNKRKYEIPWNGELSKIDSVMILFDNDKINEYGDCNLYVREIIFDNKTHIPYQNNSVYDILSPDYKGRLKNNFDSYAEFARLKLLSLGIDSALVTALPGKNVRLNRTLSSALAFRDWLKTSNIGVKGINIVTIGTHARRTWMTYNKVLDKKYNIGIISLPDYKSGHSRKYKVLKTIKESLDLVYYWFILIPY